MVSDSSSLLYPALSADHPLNSGLTHDSTLIRAYRGERSDTLPVWFMRQAGRSLPEYRKLREGTEMLESCLRPEMASEITLQPVRRHKVDAAIFFSDIVIPIKCAGVDVEIVPNVGPVLGEAVDTPEKVANLPELDDAALDPIREAVALTVAELGSTPLIGFGGAPFTVAAYMVEGKPTRDHLGPRSMMHADPQTWHALADWAGRVTAQFIRAQVEAGASAIQLFDSWAGSLSLKDYMEYAQPHSAKVFAELDDLGVQKVHFGTGTGELLAGMKAAGADVIGVDYRIPLDVAAKRVGAQTPLQGNIDPALLTAGWEPLKAEIDAVIAAGKHAPGHVLNLGHGVPPTTDPDVLTRIVEYIHARPGR